MRRRKTNTVTQYIYKHNRFTAYVGIDEFNKNAEIEIPKLAYGHIRGTWSSSTLRQFADIFNKVADDLDKLV